MHPSVSSSNVLSSFDPSELRTSQPQVRKVLLNWDTGYEQWRTPARNEQRGNTQTSPLHVHSSWPGDRLSARTQHGDQHLWSTHVDDVKQSDKHLWGKYCRPTVEGMWDQEFAGYQSIQLATQQVRVVCALRGPRQPHSAGRLNRRRIGCRGYQGGCGTAHHVDVRACCTQHVELSKTWGS